MSDKVHITKRGIVAMEWDGDIRQYVEKPVDNVLALLRLDCHIDPDVTLHDIFRAVDPYANLKEVLGAWAWCNVDAFHAEAEHEQVKKSTLDYIEIAKYFEWTESEKRDFRSADISIHVHGIGKPDPEDEQIRELSPGETISWAIDFTPVNELRHLPVRLNPTMVMTKNYGEKLGEVDTYFTLLDVLGEIYYEISFHGSPASRNEAGQELFRRLEEVKSGEAKTVLLDLDGDEPTVM